MKKMDLFQFLSGANMFVKFNTVVNRKDIKIERLGDYVYIFRPNKEYEKKHISELSYMHIKHYNEFEEILKSRNESAADYLLKRVGVYE